LYQLHEPDYRSKRKKSKEVGIRKTVGSMRLQLVRQFFAESYMIVLIAFVLSLLLVILFLPLFNEVAGKKILIPWQNPFFWTSCLLFICITGLLSGSYPALYLSSFDPIKVLKGTFRVAGCFRSPQSPGGSTVYSIGYVIIGTIIVYQQIQHAKSRPVGYSRVGLINLNMEKEIREHFEAIRTELKSAGAIEEMSASNSPLTQVWNTNGGFDWEGKDPTWPLIFRTTM
jgi:hypothetical protein